MQPLARSYNLSQQTAIPKVFGILSIIFGALVLLFGLFGAAAGALPLLLGSLGREAAAKDPNGAAMLEAISAVYGGIGAIGVIQVIMSALLLAVGIGQLRYRAWARAWSVYWGAAALLAVFVMIFVSIRMIGPGYEKLFSASAAQARGGAAPPDMGVLSSLFGGMWAGMLVFFYAPYPILLLAFFTREKVKEAMIA